MLIQMENQIKFYSVQNSSVASHKNSAAAFSWTSEVHENKLITSFSTEIFS